MTWPWASLNHPAPRTYVCADPHTASEAPSAPAKAMTPWVPTIRRIPASSLLSEESAWKTAHFLPPIYESRRLYTLIANTRSEDPPLRTQRLIRQHLSAQLCAICDIATSDTRRSDLGDGACRAPCAYARTCAGRPEHTFVNECRIETSAEIDDNMREAHISASRRCAADDRLSPPRPVSAHRLRDDAATTLHRVSRMGPARHLNRCPLTWVRSLS